MPRQGLSWLAAFCALASSVPALSASRRAILRTVQVSPSTEMATASRGVQMGHVGINAMVQKDGVRLGEKRKEYIFTNRGLAELRATKVPAEKRYYSPTAAFPPEFFDVAALQGKKVLDVAGGGGKFVKDLRAAGIDAYGLDLVDLETVPADIRAKLGLETSPHLFSGDILASRLAGKGAPGAKGLEDVRALAPFDVIYEFFGPSYYRNEESDVRNRRSLANKRDLLAVGGVMRLGTAQIDRLTRLAKQVGGLEVVQAKLNYEGDGNRKNYGSGYLELRRVATSDAR